MCQPFSQRTIKKIEEATERLREINAELRYLSRPFVVRRWPHPRREINAATERVQRDVEHKLTLGWCRACAEGQHIRCDDRIMIDKSCECGVCASIDRDAEDERVESGE